MNELTNTSLITIAILATIGVITITSVISFLVYHYIQNALVAKYKGLVKQINETSHDMITMLNDKDEQTAEFRWACDNLCHVAKTRVWLHKEELKVRLASQRDLFIEN